MAIILGSGLGDLVYHLEKPHFIPTRAIPHYPCSTVAGHPGFWVLGIIRNQPIIALQGRVHYYEGYSLSQVTFAIRLLGRMGVRFLIVTNAAGSFNPLFAPGDLMLIDDHINLFFRNPLIGANTNSDTERFVDMSKPYDPRLIAIAERAAREKKISLKKGILVGSTGPCYETAAEVRMMQKLGGDAGTMSTIPEVIVANQTGMRVLGLSCITNYATGLSQRRLHHQEVTETATRVAEKFQDLMEEIITRILAEKNL